MSAANDLDVLTEAFGEAAITLPFRIGFREAEIIMDSVREQLAEPSLEQEKVPCDWPG